MHTSMAPRSWRLWTAGLVIGALSSLIASSGSAAATPSLLPPVIGGRQEQPVRYQLLRKGNGSYQYEDKTFVANVAVDGSVVFTDKIPSLTNFKLVPFMPEPHPHGTVTLEKSVRRMLGERPRPDQPPPSLTPSPTTSFNPPRSERDRKWEAENPWVPLAVSRDAIDLTDAYYRWLGEDPYRREKARFLAATFELRLGMASRAAAADLRFALSRLPERLSAIWADHAQPPRARRRVICGLWAELARDDKGRSAGEVITRFVASQLPEGTPHAFTTDELVACNAGLPEGLRFAPYAAKR